MENGLQALIQLKKYLNKENEAFMQAAQRAEIENSWFTQEFIMQSTEAICSAYLDEEILTSFAKKYNAPSSKKQVGIIMAGNIPMVGFHDLLCAVLSGHDLVVKLSSKDKVLMTFVINQLQALDPKLNIQVEEQAKNCDAYIATGSNQSHKVFKEYFGKYPSILRRNRTSVAILDGTETEDEMNLLADDIHAYFGLGCRNITKLYVPEDYKFEPMVKAFSRYDYLEMMHKHKNNYDYQLSLLLLNQKMYMSTKALLIVEKEHLHTPLAVINYEFYTDKNEVAKSLADNEDVQAIVGHDYIPFGAAQQPSISDFADGVDTMEFLSKL